MQVDSSCLPCPLNANCSIYVDDFVCLNGFYRVEYSCISCLIPDDTGSDDYTSRCPIAQDVSSSSSLISVETSLPTLDVLTSSTANSVEPSSSVEFSTSEVEVATVGTVDPVGTVDITSTLDQVDTTTDPIYTSTPVTTTDFLPEETTFDPEDREEETESFDLPLITTINISADATTATTITADATAATTVTASDRIGNAEDGSIFLNQLFQVGMLGVVLLSSAVSALLIWYYRRKKHLIRDRGGKYAFGNIQGISPSTSRLATEASQWTATDFSVTKFSAQKSASIEVATATISPASTTVVEGTYATLDGTKSGRTEF